MSHRIAIGIKLLDRNHVALNHNFGEILIPQDIKKGESLTFTAKFSSSDFKPGEYKLFFDIKKEHITWFADQGEKPAIFDITVLS